MTTNALQQVLGILIRQLGSTVGYGGCIIVARTGEITGSHLKRAYAMDTITSLVSEAVSTCERLASECGLSWNVMAIQGVDGKMVVVNAQAIQGHIFLLGTSEMNLGMAKVLLQEAIKEFKS